MPIAQLHHVNVAILLKRPNRQCQTILLHNNARPFERWKDASNGEHIIDLFIVPIIAFYFKKTFI